LVAVAAGVMAAVPAAALVTGTLDPSFGTGGVSRVDLTEARIDVANGALEGPIGAPLLAGSANDRFALAIPQNCCFGSSRGQVVWA
jgi:hypothetical protein